MEEEIQQVRDDLRGVGISWTDGSGGVDVARGRLHRGVDRWPSGRNRAWNLRGKVEEVRLDPEPTRLQTRQRAKAASMTWTTEDGGVGPEAVRADHKRDDAAAVAREPDEGCSLVRARGWVAFVDDESGI